MGKLEVEFLGICTNIIDREATGVPHRVVLVNAKSPGDKIAPHLATLRVYTDDIVHASGPQFLPPWQHHVTVFLLDGVTLTIDGTPDEPPLYDSSFLRCMPRLTCLTPDLGELSKEVVRDHRPADAACYFDLWSGIFSARSNTGGAIRSILHTETNTTEVKVHCKPFEETEPSTLTVRRRARIVVANLPVNSSDDRPKDFLLHYRVAKRIPPDRREPNSRRCLSEDEPLTRHHSLWPDGYRTTNAGCSCAEYP